MYPHWVRPVLRSRAEHATQWSILVVPWMHAQDVAMGAVEPREDQDFLSHSQVPQPLLKFRLEDEPRLGRSLVALLRRVLAIDER
jgi:hypothetical protein